MLTFLSTALAVIVLLAAICSPIVAGSLGIAAVDDGQPIRAVIYFGGAALIVIVGLTLLVLHSGERRLCAQGHQEYQRVGKTIERVWVCDQEQAQ